MHHLGDEQFLNRMSSWKFSNESSASMWTEYTLYYLTGRCTKTFDRYHILPSSSPRLNLYGFSVWSANDWTTKNQQQLIKAVQHGLAWREKELETTDGRRVYDQTSKVKDFFMVLQSHHGVAPNDYHQLFYPLFLNHLKRRDAARKLVEILESMTSTLFSV